MVGTQDALLAQMRRGTLQYCVLSLLADEERYQSDEWAQGQWIENPETGEMEWRPAEGGEAMTADQWSHAGDEVEAAPVNAAVEAEVAAEPAGDLEQPAAAPTEEPES